MQRSDGRCNRRACCSTGAGTSNARRSLGPTRLQDDLCCETHRSSACTSGDAVPRAPSGPLPLDLGARRSDPGTLRFLQRDTYEAPGADLGLSLGLLTLNRFAYAASNPIGYREAGGHQTVPVSEEEAAVCRGLKLPTCLTDAPLAGGPSGDELAREILGAAWQAFQDKPPTDCTDAVAQLLQGRRDASAVPVNCWRLLGTRPVLYGPGAMAVEGEPIPFLEQGFTAADAISTASGEGAGALVPPPKR